jgi:putative membrane protein
MRTTRLHLTPLLPLLLLAACKSEPPPAYPENPAPVVNTSAHATMTSSTPAPAAEPMTAPPPAAQTTQTATPAASTLTDDEILQVTHTANLGEIEQGALAIAKARDSRVRELASMMVNDHTAADATGMTLMQSGLTPTRSELSSSLENQAQAATMSLRSQLAGGDFDAAYVDTQVKEHEAVLDTIDQKLLPAARSAALRRYLGDVRPKIVMHLRHARDLQEALKK